MSAVFSFFSNCFLNNLIKNALSFIKQKPKRSSPPRQCKEKGRVENKELLSFWLKSNCCKPSMILPMSRIPLIVIIAWAGGGFSWHLVSRGHGHCLTSHNVQDTLPQQRQTLIVPKAKLRNPDLEYFVIFLCV